MNSKVIIDIITDFKGLGNVKKAESAFSSLGDTLKRLAGAYTIEEVVRRSVDAFKAESSAVALLTNSLSNLGVQYNDIQPVIEKNVNTFTDLGFKSADTINSLTKLTTALGNPAKALDVLGTVADLARYKNMSLADTSVLVSKAVAGNSRAFADLGLKIDKTLTPQNAFNKLLDQAKQKAGGAAKAYAGTLAGSLDIAAAKADKAAVSLGGALAPSLQKLAELAVRYVVPAFNFLTNNITPILGVASALLAVAAAMKGVGLASAIMTGELALNPLFAAAAGIGLVAGLLLKKSAPSTGSPLRAAAGRGGVVGAYQGATAIPKQTEETKKLTDAEKLLAKFEKQWNADSLKASNAQKVADAAKIKALKDQIALEKSKQVLQSAGKVMDLNQIQLVAALMASNDPEVIKRLQLQQALLNDNADLAGKLAQQILAVQAANITVQQSDPFSGMAQGARDALDAVKALQTQLAAQGIAQAATPTWASLATDASAALADSMLGSDLDQAVKDALAASTALTSQPPIVYQNYFAGTVLADNQLSQQIASNSSNAISPNLSRLNQNYDFSK